MKRLLLIMTLATLLVQCSKDDDITKETIPDNAKEPTPTENDITIDVNGTMQKGPFVNGTSITLFDLNSSLVQTGDVFKTEIKNNLGFYELDEVTLTSNFIELSIDGYYFNEVAGNISQAPLNLLAICDVTNRSSFNINLLTHLEKQRIEYLMSKDNSFEDARKTAQAEILAIFGYDNSGLESSDELDITKNSEGNAILLAISAILQGNRSVGQLTELLANISEDIREDGILDNDNILEDLEASARQINPNMVKQNLKERYAALSQEVSIPDFEVYLFDFIELTEEPLPIVETGTINSVSETSAFVSGNVIDGNGSDVISRGICWSTSPNPTIESNNSVSGSGLGNFEINIGDLNPGSFYYVKAYATTSKGTSYGEEISFSTIDFETSKVWSNYDTQNIYLINSKGYIFKSSDNAETWQYVSNRYFSEYHQLKIVNGNLYILDRGNIYKSTDEGASWEVIPRIDSDDGYVAFAIDKNSEDIYVTTPYALFSFDGADWSRIKTTTTDNTSKAVAVDQDGYIYYSTYLFTIHRSKDKGVTWTSNKYSEKNQGWSTTDGLYVTDENVLLMNRYWDGIWWLSDMDCVPLNNGLTDQHTSKGTVKVVAKGSDYYTLLKSNEGIEGIFKSSNKGEQWIKINHNLTQYDFIKYSNLTINKSGIVFLSIRGSGVYKLDESANQWILLQ